MKRKESNHTATKEIKPQRNIVEEEAKELQNSQKKWGKKR